MTWYVRQRSKNDTAAEATVVELNTPTSAAAIAAGRADLPEGHVITSVRPY